MVKSAVTNILEEHDLDTFLTLVVEDPTTNGGWVNFKKNQAKEKRIIYESMKDNIMLMITPMKTTKGFFYTLMNLYEKKTPT